MYSAAFTNLELIHNNGIEWIYYPNNTGHNIPLTSICNYSWVTSEVKFIALTVPRKFKQLRLTTIRHKIHHSGQWSVELLTQLWTLFKHCNVDGLVRVQMDMFMNERLVVCYGLCSNNIAGRTLETTTQDMLTFVNKSGKKFNTTIGTW